MKILTNNRRLLAVYALVQALHKDQVDKCGEPYIRHLERVANRCKSISAKIVAYCHDSVEDKLITQYQLEQLGLLTGHELWCVNALNKKASMSMTNRWGKQLTPEKAYSNYIARLKEVPITREVKMADLADNMDVSRFIRTSTPMAEEDKVRLEKYERALTFLKADY